MPVPSKLIALTGAKFSGKSAAATALEKVGMPRFAFAAPIKASLLAIGVPHAALFGDDKEIFLPRFGSTGRKMMQTLADWGRAISPDFWVNLLEQNPEFQQAIQTTGAVIDDLRFPNEEAMIRRQQGTIWRIVRPSLQTNFTTDSHNSETSMEAIVPDDTLINDRSIEALQARVSALHQAWAQSHG